MGNKDESLASLFFRLALAASEEEYDPKVAKGESPEDFIYEKAERVVHSLPSKLNVRQYPAKRKS